MSEKEIALNLLDNIPAYKMGYVIAYLQGLTDYETADDVFCAQLYEDYLKSDDKGGFMPIEEVAKRCGVDMNEL